MYDKERSFQDMKKRKLFSDNFFDLGFTKHGRIKKYLHNLETHITIDSKKDREVLNEINVLIKDRINKIRQFNIINGILYFLIYFSFISLFFSDLFILSEFMKLLSKILSFFGTTVFIICVFFINKIIELYYQDLTLLAAHIISLYSDNHTEDEVLFNETNEFTKFIDFFRKEGFK